MDVVDASVSNIFTILGIAAGMAASDAFDGDSTASVSVLLSFSCSNESIKSSCLSCSDAKLLVTAGFCGFLEYVAIIAGDLPNFTKFVRCTFD